MFQSAIETSEGVSAYKNRTPFWGIGCMESLHTIHQPVSESDIKIGIQKVSLNITDRLIDNLVVSLFILAG